MPKAKRILTNLKINEGSLVTAGDNPEAHIALFKFRAGETDGPNPYRGAVDLLKSARSTREILNEDKFYDEMWKLREAFSQSIFEVLNYTDVAEMGELLQKTVNEFSAAATALAAEVQKSFPEQGKALLDVVDKLVDAATFKSLGESEHFGVDPVALETAIGSLNELYTSKASPPESTSMQTKTTEENKSFDDVLKSLGEDERGVVTSHIEALAKEAVDKALAEKSEKESKPVVKTADQLKIEKLENELEKIKEEKFEKRMAELAKDVALPGVETDVVTKLLSANFKASEESGEELLKMFRAQKAQLAKAEQILTATKGTTAPVEGSAEARADAMAKSLASSSGLTFEAAYEKVLEENPDIAREVL